MIKNTSAAASHSRGYTLVELLVVMSTIGMLMALLLPAVQQAREAARRTQCQNNLRQMVLAVEGFHGANRRYPPGRFGGPYGVGRNSRAWSWLAQTLPFVERRDLYELGQIRGATLAESVATDKQISLFLCPTTMSPAEGPRTDAGNLAGLRVGQSTYKAVCGANWGDDNSQPGVPQVPTQWRNPGTNGSYNGLDDGDGPMFRSDYRVSRSKDYIFDGTSNTFLIGEDVPEDNIYVSWPYANNGYGTCAIPPNVRGFPVMNWWNLWSFRSWHPGGLNFAIADGSVRWINGSVELRVYRALATIRGSEITDDDEWR